MATIEETIAVLFMLGEQKLPSKFHFGANRTELLELCSKLFNFDCRNVVLQSYDNEWQEWINLPEDFVLTRRLKLKVIASSSDCDEGIPQHIAQVDGWKQSTLTSTGSFIEVGKTIPSKPAYHSFLIPNPHSERLQFYNNLTPSLYLESYPEFSSKERFTNFLITERKWRYDTEQQVKSFMSMLDNIQSNDKSGFSHNFQRLQRIPADANSEDVLRCRNVISSLENLRDKCQKLLDNLIEKKKSCYKPSMDLLPGGKIRLKYIESKSVDLNQFMQKLYSMLANFNTVEKALCVRFSQKSCEKADKTRKKRRLKEQRRKNTKKKSKVLHRQTKEVCSIMLCDPPEELDLTKEVSEPVPVFTKEKLNEINHSNLKPRFHLVPLQMLLEKGYVAQCAIPEVQNAITYMEQKLLSTKTITKTSMSEQTIKLTDFFKGATDEVTENDNTTSDIDSDTDSDSENHSVL